VSTVTRVLSVGDEVWIATALLHREQPDRPDFTVEEIIARLQAEGLAGEVREGVKPHVYKHCVANLVPKGGKLRMLYRTGTNTRRLFRPGDDFHSEREGPANQQGTRTTPRAEDIPPRYRHLLDWYLSEYAPTTEETDPILALSGIGKHLWTGIDPDEYVRQLREGWE
jgi:hypothetical protein